MNKNILDIPAADDQQLNQKMVRGIHHITALASNAQATLNFYQKVLGLRLVKKSVNQDAPDTYHLFFGNTTGNPGMDLTFFPFAGIKPGQAGAGLVTAIHFAIPTGAINFWVQRLTSLDITMTMVHKNSLRCEDPDGLSLILTEYDHIAPLYRESVWKKTDIDTKYAIHCFAGALLSSSQPEQTAQILRTLGYQEVEQSQEHATKDHPVQRFTLPSPAEVQYFPATQLMLEQHIESGRSGSGTVHHIAFTVPDEAALNHWRSQLHSLGLHPTEIIDRYYFKSVYFRLNDEILCELATEDPGFAVDEAVETLGEHLALPPFLEPHRDLIERALPPL